MKKNLSSRISEKIRAIREAEDDFPGVIILHDIRDSTVVHMSEWGLAYLNVTLKELLQMGTEYHNRYFNPEDAKDYVPKILGLLERNNNNELVSYFQQVRRSPKHEWAWFLSATKICLRDESGNPVLTFTTAIPVDAQHHIAVKGQRLLEENNFLRKNHHLFDHLTKREKEILKMMALGLSSGKMSKQMHISEKTANTHRRNIKRKLKVKNTYDITRFAQAFDLV